MRYRILFNYGTEGYNFMDGEFETVEVAVKKAIEINYSSPFIVVKIIDWEVKEKDTLSVESK